MKEQRRRDPTIFSPSHHSCALSNGCCWGRPFILPKVKLNLKPPFFWNKISYFRTLPKNLLVKVLSCSLSIFETNQLLVSTPTANRSSPFVNLEQTIEQTESLQRNSCWKILLCTLAASQSIHLIILNQLFCTVFSNF